MALRTISATFSPVCLAYFFNAARLDSVRCMFVLFMAYNIHTFDTPCQEVFLRMVNFLFGRFGCFWKLLWFYSFSVKGLLHIYLLSYSPFPICFGYGFPYVLNLAYQYGMFVWIS